jgi:hypothetical protein
MSRKKKPKLSSKERAERATRRAQTQQHNRGTVVFGEMICSGCQRSVNVLTRDPLIGRPRCLRCWPQTGP